MSFVWECVHAPPITIQHLKLLKWITRSHCSGLKPIMYVKIFNHILCCCGVYWNRKRGFCFDRIGWGHNGFPKSLQEISHHRISDGKHFVISAAVHCCESLYSTTTKLSIFIHAIMFWPLRLTDCSIFCPNWHNYNCCHYKLRLVVILNSST